MPEHKDDIDQEKLVSHVMVSIGDNTLSDEVIDLVKSKKLDPAAYLFNDDFGKKSLFHLAAEKGNYRVVQYLIDNSLIDINLCTRGEPPRHALDFMCNGIVEYKHWSIIAYLLSNKDLDIEALDEQGVNQLDQALFYNNCGHLLLLLTDRQNNHSVGNGLIQRELFRLKFGLNDNDETQFYAKELSTTSALSLILPYLQKSFMEYAASTDTPSLERISKCFAHNAIYNHESSGVLVDIDVTSMVSQYHAGEMVLIYNEQDGHSASYVLQGETLYCCFRQSDDSRQGAIKVFQILEPENIDDKRLSALLHSGSPETELNLKFLEELDDTELQFNNNVLSAAQKALYAMIFHHARQGNIPEKQQRSIHQSFKNWLSWDRQQQVDKFIASFSDNPLFVKQALEEALAQLDDDPDTFKYINTVLQNSETEEPNAMGKRKPG